jgi:hypothetical protein
VADDVFNIPRFSSDVPVVALRKELMAERDAAVAAMVNGNAKAIEHAPAPQG